MLVGQKTRLTEKFLRYRKFKNVIGLEILSEISFLLMTYSLTRLKNAKLYGKREKCSLFWFDNALRFPQPNCQILTNLNFENSFVTII